ncbi:hypothetical protein [Arcanobacterium canis]
MSTPVLFLDFLRRAVVKVLVELAGVLPGHPLKGCDLDLEDVVPRASVDELVFIRAVDVFG